MKKNYNIVYGLETAYRQFFYKHRLTYLLGSVYLLIATIFYASSHPDSPQPTTPVRIAENSAPVTLQTDSIAISTKAEAALSKPEKSPWQTVTVQANDNLARIFKRKKLSARMLHNIMSSDKDTAVLKHLKPDQELFFMFEDDELMALRYELSLTDTLDIRKVSDDTYSVNKLRKELQTKLRTASGTIEDSLFLSAKKVGISDKVIMQMIEIYGWDIDFALEVRQGDQFHLVHEEYYKDGKKVQDGPILTAEFINRGKSFQTVRYTHADGHSDYYAANGDSMRKAFLRTPINFAYISSHFNLWRKHPILNNIRAHKGVDYAARPSTPIKAAGQGTIKLAARKGGYGKAVVIQHGNKYTTLYGHLSAYARGIKSGTYVKQGQIIGYVGMTGLATGPHLHYEFRVNGQHKNPLTVKLPKVSRIPDKLIDSFKTQTAPLLTQLDNARNDYVHTKPLVVALNANQLSSPSVPD